jgi:hypothetical protein
MLRAMATAVLLVAALIVTLNPSITDDLAPIPGAKREVYLAGVAAGALQLDGRRFDSPSAAAVSITTHPVNGWTFWQCRIPGQGTWKLLKELRRKE